MAISQQLFPWVLFFLWLLFCSLRELKYDRKPQTIQLYIPNGENKIYTNMKCVNDGEWWLEDVTTGKIVKCNVYNESYVTTLSDETIYISNGTKFLKFLASYKYNITLDKLGAMYVQDVGPIGKFSEISIKKVN